MHRLNLSSSLSSRSEMGPYFVTDDLKKMEYSSGSIDLYHFGSNFLHPEDIVDTTGAGDGFIGATIYGILANLPLGKTIALASYVAAEKIKKKGARSGLPSLDDVRSALAL
jgi:sugar/nucleoside kinase (ribokinase family)